MAEIRVEASPRKHVLTIAVEDYFQATALQGIVPSRQWARFERRVENNTRRTLDLLDACGAKATFFVLGWIADEMTELVREIVVRGHEVASKGYHHRPLREMTTGAFREDLLHAREVIERAGRRKVLGYRIATGSFGLEDLWALDVLAEEGFAYDSSMYPRLRSIGGEAWRRFPFRHVSPRGDVIVEVPLSSYRAAGLSIPFAGGNYFRQLPHALAKRVLREWDARYEAPFVLHFHVWELDPEQPSITAAGALARVRQQRNLARMPERIRDHLQTYRFGGVADYLGLVPAALEERPRPPAPVRLATRATTLRTPVTVVVPCYNEELVLPYLANTLKELRRDLESFYDLRFVFVDDGSSDRTWDDLHRLFGSLPSCSVIRQPRNMGVAAAILAGIRASSTEVVCSIDCDCTYDPHQLAGMIPLFGDGVDLVTASPYHPDGGVLNVPAWRLALSKSLSRMYRVVLGEKLATFTSCFRVYRRSAFIDLDLHESGFLGVAEMVGLLAMRRARIAEYPALLEVRMLGRSKMKILRTILGHLRLLGRFAFLRAQRSWSPRPPLSRPASPGVSETADGRSDKWVK